MNIVERIKQLTAEKGISITELEEKCELPSKSIYKWDRNKPSVDRVARVAIFLKVDVDYLIGMSEYRTRYQEFEDKYINDGNPTFLKSKTTTMDFIKNKATMEDLAEILKLLAERRKELEQ